MKIRTGIAVSFVGAALIATPIIAQQNSGSDERPARQCFREVMRLCSDTEGRGREKIRTCLQSKFTDLSPSCQDQIWDKVENRLRENRAENAKTYDRTALMQPTVSVAFGKDERQQVDYFAANPVETQPPPLLMFVHGGGWSIGTRKAVQSKPVHFTGAGYAFASTGYRLLPDAPVEEQARDVGQAIQTMRSQASKLGFDPDQIIVMGHSAGAHLAALVSTDPQYAGDAFEAIRGTILLDGAGYNIPAQINGSGSTELPGLYKRVFGDDADRHRALSPIHHIGGADAENWLILHVSDRESSSVRSNELGDALTNAGLNANVIAIENTDHGRLNQELGTAAGTQATEAIDQFLKREPR